MGLGQGLEYRDTVREHYIERIPFWLPQFAVMPVQYFLLEKTVQDLD